MITKIDVGILGRGSCTFPFPQFVSKQIQEMQPKLAASDQDSHKP